jgi:uncharacterized phage-like protein YoqJ
MGGIRMKACCFTGHRDLPKGEAEQLTEKAKALILLLIQEGFTEFRVGGAVGFDMIMAELLLRLRDEKKQEIRIISVIPFPSWRAKWSSEEIRRQNVILEKSDEVIFVRQHYCQGIYMIRNRALADGAQVCIAYCNRPKGGTAWTVRYAKQNGLRTYNLAGGEGK